MQAKPRLEWRPQASADLLEIVAYIADDNPDAAQELKDEIEAKPDKLPDHPRLYKPSVRVKGLRELIVRSNYIVFYRESPELVEVVNVIHARRQWPPKRSTAWAWTLTASPSWPSRRFERPLRAITPQGGQRVTATAKGFICAFLRGCLQKEMIIAASFSAGAAMSRPGKPPTLTPEHRQTLQAMVSEMPTATRGELQRELKRRTGVEVHVQTIHKALARCGIVRARASGAVRVVRTDPDVRRYGYTEAHRRLQPEQTYPSCLTDAEWALAKCLPHLPSLK
jgi:toxin ParE1/3/4